MDLSPESTKLLLEIAHCEHVASCLDGSVPNHPCAKIVGLQQETLGERQVPEPWSGDLASARILFLGSNPGISYVEDYPQWSWADDRVVDFFARRFGGGRREWVRSGLYIRLRDGTFSRDWVRYWAAVHRRAEELLDRGRAVPGHDYALSEVVHCKSRHEVGVAEAMDACASRYLARLVACSSARVVVSLGRLSSAAVRRVFDLPEGQPITGPVRVGEIERYFTFLAHPSAFKAKTFGCLPSESLALLREAVGTASR